MQDLQAAHGAVLEAAGQGAVVQQRDPQPGAQLLRRTLIQLWPYLHIHWLVALLLCEQ